MTIPQNYNPQSFESRWQDIWEDVGLYRAQESSTKPKYYCLDFFPYPSGEGLHVGHCRNYVPTDVVSRYWRMNGYNVLHPMGWDAFGEPAEQFAIKHGIHPRLITDLNTSNYKRQLRLIGTGYDWSREIDSSRPEYYRWTQWIFLQMYERGLAYRDTNWQWWCPICATTLSSHEIHGDRCWRGHKGVTKREIPAWYFRITAYADELISGLDEIDWPEPIKVMQRNWIGRSDGCKIDFIIPGLNENISVFTTRPDTLFGVTFLALAPEHHLVTSITTADRLASVMLYRQQAISHSDIERTAEGREKTGKFSGGYVRHPLNGNLLPVWIADYVLPTYGTGAVMGVPAHDQRDYVFAEKYSLPKKTVIVPNNGQIVENMAYEGDGLMINSGNIDGMDNLLGGQEIVKQLREIELGHAQINYRMHDWLISRQRYWGTPIPIIYCDNCGEMPAPEDDLPVLLPPMEDFAPDGTGRSPLARVPEFINTICPDCGQAARRETDTMGGFACSSWYFLRFTSPDCSAEPFDPTAMHYWMPVDLYVGGAEHAVLHLLYARFWTKFLADEGLLHFREPFSKLVNQGQLRGKDGFRMSKSRGNVVTPDELVNQYGADALRLYVMFMAPFESDVEWSEEGIRGTHRFLSRLWHLYRETYTSSEMAVGEDTELLRFLSNTVQAVTERIESFRFNTMVSILMEFSNTLYDRWRENRWNTQTFHQSMQLFLVLLAPAAPYFADELWHLTGNPGSIHNQPWPKMQQEFAEEQTKKIPVQVNGKLREILIVPNQWSQEQIEKAALTAEPVVRSIGDLRIKRIIHVAGKIVNVVTENR